MERDSGGSMGILLLAALAGLGVLLPLRAQGQAQEHATIAWEAEDFAAMVAPVLVESSEGASAGHCVTALERVSPSGAGVQYVMRVPRTGTYYPWFRLRDDVGWRGWGQLLVDGTHAGPLILAVWRKQGWHWAAGQSAHPALHYSRTLRLTEGRHSLGLGEPGICLDGIWRAYGKLDMILLTTDPGFSPGGPDGSPVPATPGLILSQQRPETLLSWEAEDVPEGEVAGEVGSLAGAHRGTVLRCRPGEGAPPTYRVRVPRAGRYYLWARVCRDILQGNSQDPFFLRAKVGEHELRLGRHWPHWPEPYWAWVRDYEHHSAGHHSYVRPVPVELEAGETEVVVTAAQPHAALDQFALTNDPDFVPAADGRQPLEPASDPLPG